LFPFISKFRTLEVPDSSPDHFENSYSPAGVATIETEDPSLYVPIAGETLPPSDGDTVTLRVYSLVQLE
jgi:hypothetical protein